MLSVTTKSLSSRVAMIIIAGHALGACSQVKTDSNAQTDADISSVASSDVFAVMRSVTSSTPQALAQLRGSTFTRLYDRMAGSLSDASFTIDGLKFSGARTAFQNGKDAMIANDATFANVGEYMDHMKLNPNAETATSFKSQVGPLLTALSGLHASLGLDDGTDAVTEEDPMGPQPTIESSQKIAEAGESSETAGETSGKSTKNGEKTNFPQRYSPYICRVTSGYMNSALLGASMIGGATLIEKGAWKTATKLVGSAINVTGLAVGFANWVGCPGG